MKKVLGLGLAVLVVIVVACVPSPTLTPTPTPMAIEPCSLLAEVKAIISSPKNPRTVDLKPGDELSVTVGEIAILTPWFYRVCESDTLWWRVENRATAQVEGIGDGKAILVPMQSGRTTVYFEIIGDVSDEVPFEVFVPES